VTSATITVSERRALVALASCGRDGTSSGTFGAVYFGKDRKSKGTSMGGGGDYPAQMLLGRLKKKGLVRHSMRFRDGSTVWELTATGLLAIGGMTGTPKKCRHTTWIDSVDVAHRPLKTCNECGKRLGTCPNCKLVRALNTEGLIAYHDFPEPCRAVCRGSLYSSVEDVEHAARKGA